MKSSIAGLVLASFFLISCEKEKPKLTQEQYDALTEEQKRSPEFALDGIEVLDDRLELELFASEPMLTNPTNMDIDDRGRVWVTEAYNYRIQLNPKNPTKAEGDRILILEDTDGDSKADKSTVFYQGTDINAALGIAVFGNKVFVSVSPNVFVFTDENGDDIPDKKEVLFTGVGGVQHDHGMHAFTFGPDGKLYFNYGNEGKGLHYADGSPILDPLGRPVTSETAPYQEGMVFRCDPDGSNPEVLAWNFRNNYEVSVDSYGRMWQSDNDDDGNRSTRINFVMDYGNYGFKDEITKADWRTRRVNMEDSVWQQHWHLNDPGVVPNLIQNYAGSPTGILVYEGKLLPEEYQNQVIHADAGPNVIRMYPVKPSGAGFTGEVVKILDGNARDNWFRPSDVTVAPDGSIFISDWYDPGVGGHAVGDLEKGRIYRLAPKRSKYRVSAPDYSTDESLIELLQNPNRAIHFKAFMALKEKGEEARGILEKFYALENSRMKARAFWLLIQLPNGNEFIKKAAEDQDENIRVAAIKAYRIKKMNDPAFLLKMAGDPSDQVKREVAEAIRYQDAPEIWQKLAEGYRSGDRWYLEALGIAGEYQWETYLPVYLEKAGPDWKSKAEAKDIVWRSRSSSTPALLEELILEEASPADYRYYRALDFQNPDLKNQTLKNLLAKGQNEDQVIILRQAAFDSKKPDGQLLSLAKSKAGSIPDDRDFLEIVRKYQLKDQKERLLSLIYQNDNRSLANTSAGIFTQLYGITDIEKAMKDTDEAKAILAIRKFGAVDSPEMATLLNKFWGNPNASNAIRTAAMEEAKGYQSEAVLWEFAKKDEIPADLLPIAQKILMGSWNSNIRQLAAEKYGDSIAQGYDLVKMMSSKGDAAVGKTIAATYCLACHKIDKEGVDFGPALSQIGAKLSREALINAIIYPSEGMGFGYETQLVKFKDGKEIRCIVNSKTENDLIVKLVGSGEQTIYKLADIESVTQLGESLMPAFPLTEQELVDLVEYLGTLK
ncbi:putative membrane-bound dehydrogenase-like protein [Algoriphagus boseongensis]|uniref:Putative membrane-bound dehydrogenase-like protein n=1 Tax=Algoriphagus boseongensis TaxID=1442587 RepID=A0A4R6T643_9BACT|nr:PVC-type heme-binding CxxCH protein [Algoriphagus boseongensis]TDQ16388.1 putative membrane-bound dehydrogenase-like protein [Algoriphagus boseongensis]